MISPLSFVKNVRTVYDRFYQKNVKEVQVQFQNEKGIDYRWSRVYSTPLDWTDT